MEASTKTNIEKFEKLGLNKEILDVLSNCGFEEPTEIQEKAIPLALAGKDIIGGSATGSGKTLVFAAPIIEKLIPNNHVQALILTPTRELAEQDANSIIKFAKNKKLVVASIYGGVDINPQIRKLAVADVVVATPGRVLDHLQRRTLSLREVKFLVLDEVDRMFDMGFQHDVEKIIAHCPKHRQTMMFSATISGDVDHLAKKYSNNAVEVSVDSYVDASKLKQIYYDLDGKLKFSLLVYLLKKEKSDLVMVFCGTRRNVDYIAHNLNKHGIAAQAIHGGLSQNNRLNVLKDFHGKGVSVLVCTDVAARGLDIKGVSHVYNYDLPDTSEKYIHRIGRTARAGEEGKAVSLLCSRDYDNFKNVLRDEELKIELEDTPKIPILNTENVSGTRRRFGSRDTSQRRSFGSGRRFGSRGGSDGRRSGGRFGSRFGNRERGSRDSRNLRSRRYSRR